MRFSNPDMFVDVLDGMTVVRICEIAETFQYRMALINRQLRVVVGPAELVYADPRRQIIEEDAHGNAGAWEPRLPVHGKRVSLEDRLVHCRATLDARRSLIITHPATRIGGHEVMLTFDKDMADGTPPLIPVLIFDVVEAKDMLDTSKVLADVLLANEFDVPDYYPVAAPRKTPSKALCNIALGLYAQNKHDGFVGKGFLRARWDTRNLDIEEAPHHASTRARMVYRRKQGLPMTEAKFRASRTR